MVFFLKLFFFSLNKISSVSHSQKSQRGNTRGLGQPLPLGLQGTKILYLFFFFCRYIYLPAFMWASIHDKVFH